MFRVMASFFVLEASAVEDATNGMRHGCSLSPAAAATTDLSSTERATSGNGMSAGRPLMAVCLYQ